MTEQRTPTTRTVCPHGSLRRQCEVCERDEEIADLRRQLHLANVDAGLMLAQSTDSDVENRELRAEVQRLTADLAGAHEQLADQTARWAAVVNERDALRARIDALMLEYCPDEMTSEQTAEWARHQVPHQLTASEAAERSPTSSTSASGRLKSGPPGTYRCDCQRDDPMDCGENRDERLGRHKPELGTICFCPCHKWRVEERERRNSN